MPDPYRLIALDLDGTLLSPGGAVTPRARAAVLSCIEAGYVVCFATGRNHTESRAVIEQVGHFDAAVFVGGAMVVDTRTGTTLHRTGMAADLAAAVVEEIESAGHAALALQDTERAGVDYYISGDRDPHPSHGVWTAAMKVRCDVVAGLASADHAHTVRLGAVVPSDSGPELERRLTRRFAERVYLHRIRVPGTGVDVVEVFDPSVNKWAGIMKVAETRGIPPEAIIAVGDDMNDLHMVRAAGLGVAMGNAREEIKAVADRVIGSNAEEGLAAFLEELTGYGPLSVVRCQV